MQENMDQKKLRIWAFSRSDEFRDSSNLYIFLPAKYSQTDVDFSQLSVLIIYAMAPVQCFYFYLTVLPIMLLEKITIFQ